MNLLVYTSLWPNAERPNFAVFVKHRIAAMSRLENVRLRVVAPVPYFPQKLRFPLIPTHWQQAARLAEREEVAGIETFHPRHLVTPKLGMSFYARWMANGTEKLVRNLHGEQRVDLIDAHYVYPDGYAAVLLGERLNLPVVITARGTDINLFSRMPMIRPMIGKALKRAAGIIAVSDALKQRMIELGIEAEKIAVIRNGVARDLFYPRDRAEAREYLGLGAESRIVLTVSALVPLKGIDCLIEAVGRVEDLQLKFYIIGDGPEKSKLQAMIESLRLQNRVFLAGPRPQAELPAWYSAADLFCLASHREGCPNVLIEAMACGVPVVAADVGGIRELIPDRNFGLVVAAPTAKTFAEAIRTAITTAWNRDEIAALGRARSWNDVAKEIIQFYVERRLTDETSE